MNIAIYTFNSSTDTVPTFNDEFEKYTYDFTLYEQETKYVGVIDPNAKITIIIEGYEHTLENGTVYDNYIIYMPTTGLDFYHYTDGTESMLVSNNEPQFTYGFPLQIEIKSIQYTDVDNGDGTITRTITSDTLPSNISFSEKSGLVSLSYLDTSNVTDMSYMFEDCWNLTSLDVSSFDTSNVIYMGSMFRDCSSLTALNLSNFNTSNVTDMRNMFYGCNSLTSLDLSSFNTSNVTTMQSMFEECTSLTSIDLSSFNTSNVTDMSLMFSVCSSLTSLDVSNFNIDKVTNMVYMFIDCTKLTSVNMENSNVTSINKIITQLPTRTANSYGTMTVSKNVLNSVDTTSANSKYWNVIKSPEYSFTLDTLKYLLTTIKSKFVTKEEMNNKVDKVDGKQLSSNNFSDEDVNNINNSFDDAEVNQNGTTISFYSTSVDGTKTKIKDIDLDI